MDNKKTGRYFTASFIIIIFLEGGSIALKAWRGKF